MARFVIDMLDGSPVPKRGDLLQTNPGDRRSRTWFILAVHGLRPTRGVPRARLWIERWWQTEVPLRNALFRSAERRGGQQVILARRYPAKKRKTFEEYMAAGRPKKINIRYSAPIEKKNSKAVLLLSQRACLSFGNRV